MRLKLHFCGEELSGVKIVWVGDKGAMCGCGEESEEDECCHNHHENLKVDSHQNDALKFKAEAQVLHSLFTSLTNINVFTFLSEYLQYVNVHPPPDIVQQNIISTSVLLI